jgi:hypothetical protein
MGTDTLASLGQELKKGNDFSIALAPSTADDAERLVRDGVNRRQRGVSISRHFLSFRFGEKEIGAMHHKRRRPKNRRAGCLLCKPHKANHAKGSEAAQTLQERRARARERLMVAEVAER